MKRISILTIMVLLILILFRANILIFFNNVFGMFQEKNKIEEAEIRVLEEKINYLEQEKEDINILNKTFEEYATYNYFVSKVMYKENYFYNAKVYIEGGSKDKLKKGMAVVNEKGMVGIIGNVEKQQSELILLTNTNNISVNIRNSYGKLEYKEGVFKVSDISKNEDIKLNDAVYTSTLGNIKEKLYIGKVKSVEDNTLEKEIIVESSVDFNKLNYLLVVGDV